MYGFSYVSSTRIGPSITGEMGECTDLELTSFIYKKLSELG